MSYTCLIIDLWFGRYIVDVTAATYQKAVLAVVQPFHASYAPGTVEVREAVNADPTCPCSIVILLTRIIRCFECC